VMGWPRRRLQRADETPQTYSGMNFGLQRAAGAGASADLLGRSRDRHHGLATFVGSRVAQEQAGLINSALSACALVLLL
jgi:hypothetical protein